MEYSIGALLQFLIKLLMLTYSGVCFLFSSGTWSRTQVYQMNSISGINFLFGFVSCPSDQSNPLTFKSIISFGLTCQKNELIIDNEYLMASLMKCGKSWAEYFD